jgi:hypothetical protein
MVRDLTNPEVSVELDGRGMGKVRVGGVDIGRHIETVTVQTKAGERTTVTLGMPFAGAKATGEVQLDEETSKALEALGWTGPDEMLLRRRDLQEALGGLGAVLRTWDELLQIARAIESDAAGNLEGAKTQLRTALAEFGPQGEEPDWETLMMCVHGVAHRLGEVRGTDGQR